jgi:hypothetical protein
MALYKPNCVTSAALIVLSMLAASAQAARAETIALTCQGQQDNNGAPFLIKVNTDNNTVFDSRIVGSSGIYPAQITDEEMSWDEMQVHSTLNRTTGNLHEIGQGTSTGFVGNVQCHKAEKQF